MVSLKETAAAGGLFFFLLLCSCGEFDSVLPINETYQVSAMAGDHSLDEYSGISLNVEIQPFFSHSIRDDQDIRGLVVYLQTPGGKAVGPKIRYAIGEYEEAKDGEVLIEAAGTDRKLSGFQLPEDLETGPYRMVFQILGEKGQIVSRTEKPVFYLAAEDYTISEISAYLPGYSPDAYLIAPGTVIMLEARLTAGEGLDPYLVWYDGKKRIDEGRSLAGGSRLFFTVPEENGFRLLRAEAFPFPPAEKKEAENSEPGERARGKIRELSLPVSFKGTGPDYFLPVEKEGNNVVCRYLFAGDLRDSIDSRPERLLVNESAEGVSNWLGYGGIYGLAVGVGDSYLIPQAIFGSFQDDEKIFSFRCKMLGDGPVFSVLLSNGSGGLQLSRESEHLLLTLTAEGNSNTASAALPATEDFFSFTLSLAFRENTLTAVLSPEGTPEAEASLDLGGASGGELIYRLGAPAPAATEEEAPEEEGEESPPDLPALILDELAVMAAEE
jgi:hypothetical protein